MSSYRTLRLSRDVFLQGRVQPWEQKKKLAQGVWEALQRENALTIGLGIDANGERFLVISEDEASRLKRSINVNIRSPQPPPLFKSVSPISFAKAQSIEKFMNARKSAADDEECMFETLRLLCYLSYYPDDIKYFSMKVPSTPVRIVALFIRHWEMDSTTRLGFQLYDGLMGRGVTDTCNFQAREHAALDAKCSGDCRLSGSSRDMHTGLQVLKDKLCSGSPTLLLVLEADDAVMALLQEANVTVTSSLSAVCQPQEPPSRPSGSSRGDYRGSSYRPSHDGYGDRYPPQRDRGWERAPSRGFKREYDDDRGRDDYRYRSRSPRRMSPHRSRARSRSPPRASSGIKTEGEDAKATHSQTPNVPIIVSLKELHRTARNDLTTNFGVKNLSPFAEIKCERHCSDAIYNAFMALVKGPPAIQWTTGTAPPAPPVVPSASGSAPTHAPAPAPAPVAAFDEDDTEPQAPLPPTATKSRAEPIDDFSDSDDDGPSTLYHAPGQSSMVSANRYENEY